jgi:hypothetical protein
MAVGYGGVMSEAGVYYPPETRVLPLTVIRRERMLPMPGRVLVNPGERLQASQVVAQTEVSGEVSVVNVAQLLRVSPARAAKYVKVREGADVNMNTVIASKGLTAAGRIKSPANGFVYRIDKATGRVLIKIVSQPYELTAYLAGSVANVIAGRGVLVETTGALIQAAFGLGGESYGVLQVVSNRPTDPMRARSIDVTMHGAIIVGGAWFDEAVLQQAIQMQVRGLIAGSMDGGMLEAARMAPFPILLTEGFGHIPMATPIFRLLKSNVGREVSISALTRTRWGVQRPEVLIPLPSDSRPEPPTFGMPLAVGVRVRVLRGARQGKVGQVTLIPEQPQQIESGAKVRCAEIDLSGDDGHVMIPFANLEILR